MASAGAGFLDHLDLGLPADSDACRDLADELGSGPPWPVPALKAYFDRRYPGWDDAPQLALSSPVSRLRGLVEAAAQGSDDEGANEALRELGAEVKHAQIRVMCPRVEGGNFHDECNFLLLTLAGLGEQLLAEREARQRDRQAAERRLADEREARRGAGQEAAQAAKESARQQLEELSAEAEAQQRRADGLQRKAEALDACERHRAELEQRVEELERDHLRLQRAHDTSREELQAAQAQRAALAAAHEDSQGALDDLQRRLQQAATEKPTASAKTSAKHSAGSGAGGSEELLAKGARAALALLGSSGPPPLRPLFLAWRCSCLEARYARIGENAAATSLQADLSMMGCSHVSTLCCCRSQQDTCCRKTWLKGTLELLQEETTRAEHADAKAAAAAASAARAASAMIWHRLLTASSLCTTLLLLVEPQLTMLP